MTINKYSKPIQKKPNITPPAQGTNGNLSKCLKCFKVFYFQPEHKHHQVEETDIIEMGCNCPHCAEWLHLGYLNENLLERQQELTNNRRRRAFRRDYEKWQKEVREMLEKEFVQPVKM